MPETVNEQETWEFDPENFGINREPGYGLLDGNGRPIGVTVHTVNQKLFGKNEPYPDPEGKARLIAAAPDLLVVANLGYELSSWTACINWRGGENQKEWLDDLRQKIEEFQPFAKAAIAKATGKD